MTRKAGGPPGVPAALREPRRAARLRLVWQWNLINEIFGGVG